MSNQLHLFKEDEDPRHEDRHRSREQVARIDFKTKAEMEQFAIRYISAFRDSGAQFINYGSHWSIEIK